MKQIILTGATGFIGSFFTKYLLENDIQVIALGRKEYNEISEYRKNLIDGSTYIKINMNEIYKLPAILSEKKIEINNDCVFFNLAWGGESKLSDLNILAQLKNVEYSINAFDIASEIKCKKFIQVGTMEEAFTEKYLNLDYSKSDKYNRHVIYSVAKISAKNALKLRASKSQIELIYVLHSHIMGPNDDKDSFLQVTLQKLINNEELSFSSGEQLFDVVSLEDCAYGYFLICNKGKENQDYWVGSGEPKKLKEYVKRMYKLFPSKQKLNFGSLPYNDIVLTEEDFSINNLQFDTGYKPKLSYEETVKDLYNYLKKID